MVTQIEAVACDRRAMWADVADTVELLHPAEQVEVRRLIEQWGDAGDRVSGAIAALLSAALAETTWRQMIAEAEAHN